MPKIMFNGVTYGIGGGGGNANLVELTKAEYDALDVAGEVKADTLYLITDGIPGTNAGMGNTDISGVGDGTVTGAIGALSVDKLSNNKIYKYFESTSDSITLDLVNESIYEFTLVASTIMAKYIVRPISSGVRSWYVAGTEDYLMFSSTGGGKVVLKPKYGSTYSYISYQCLY